MLTKQAVDISFAKGLDLKTDPKRVLSGNFVSLQNTIFLKGGLLQKRNGNQQLTSLPANSSSYVTTLNDNLTAVGTSIAAYEENNAKWVTKGSIAPMSINTLPLIRNNFNQTAADSVVGNGLVLTAYLEYNGSTTTNKYVIADAITGQNIVAPTAIPVSSGTVSGGMRTFLLGNNFIIAFTNTISGTAHLQYIAISTYNPTVHSVNTDIASSYVPATTLSWDGFVAGNYLYVAYDTTAGGQAVDITSLSANFTLASPTSFAGYTATMMSVTADITGMNPVVYMSFYNSGSSTGFVAILDKNLNKLVNPIEIITSGTYLNITSAAQNGSVSVFAELQNNYSFDSGLPTNLILSVNITPISNTTHSVFSSGASSITVASASGLVTGMTVIDNTTPANIAAFTTITVSGTSLALSNNTAGNSASSPGDLLSFVTKGTAFNVIRSVGLASKAFIVKGTIYFLSAFQSSYQSTYFLINGSLSTSASPIVAAKLAYENGGGYLTLGLPGVTVTDNLAQIAYLYKDLIAAVNKNTNVPSGTQIAGIYSQTGINLVSFEIGTQNFDTAEIASNLHLSGGFLWIYDGYLPVEHNFFLWPDTDQTNPTDTASWSASGGSIVAKPDGATNTNAYYVQFTYEWTDNAGNAYRSAPSIPVAITTSGSGSSGSITYNIPTLRLTYKVANPVKIVAYRWSVGQQVYYQTTSISVPLLNDTTVDSVQFVDTNSDATILGNNILYTTGGVVEDVNAPATNLLALFDTRLWLVDAEDQNLLWFSKQVIEATPVEMSDLFTMYIAPTTSSEGSTGPITSIFPMDDKLCIGKQNAWYYINGTGPDNTGANNQYSQPILITTSVGCTNQSSIVFTPMGLMFQSNKGIWLLDRSLQTNYIGAPVENFTNGATVLSALLIPATNQVRFTLDSGLTLMYDYYYGEWGTFTGIPAIGACIYGGFHTFIDNFGRVFQESPNSFLDGSNPVLLSFTTGPLRLGDLQNYQRAFFFYLLGTYYSPHKLQVSISYDYNTSPSHSVLLSPINYSTPYGSGPSQSPYGQGTPFGGPGNIEQFRVFLDRQRCQAFAITVQEVYDPTYGAPAGQGLSLSGINLVMAFKKGFATVPSNISFG